MAKRDPRVFRTFVRMADDGAVAAVTQVDHTVPLPTDGENNLYIDVSAFPPQNLHALKVQKADIDSKDAVRVQAALVVASDARKVDGKP